MVKGETPGQPGGDGPVCGPGHHHLHCLEHTVHGHGALPHDGAVQQCALCRESGKTPWDLLFPLKMFMIAFVNFMCHSQIKHQLTGVAHKDSKICNPFLIIKIYCYS